MTMMMMYTDTIHLDTSPYLILSLSIRGLRTVICDNLLRIIHRGPIKCSKEPLKSTYLLYIKKIKKSF